MKCIETSGVVSALDFHYQITADHARSLLPGFAHEWAADVREGRQAKTLLVLRNAPLIDVQRPAPRSDGPAAARASAVSERDSP